MDQKWLQWNILVPPIKITHRTTLTGRHSNAGRDADTVVNDSKHVDVVLHACFQAWDGAGGGIPWDPYLELHTLERDR